MEWALSQCARKDISDFLEQHDLKVADEGLFCRSLAEGVRTYLRVKALAQESSSTACRTHLRAACQAADELRKRVQDLDGTSMRLLACPGAINVSHYAARLKAQLDFAESIALRKFPLRGDRPHYERVEFAGFLRRLLERFTTAKVDAKPAGPFVGLVQLSLYIAEGREQNLHSLAERALATDAACGWIEACVAHASAPLSDLQKD